MIDGMCTEFYIKQWQSFHRLTQRYSTLAVTQGQTKQGPRIRYVNAHITKAGAGYYRSGVRLAVNEVRSGCNRSDIDCFGNLRHVEIPGPKVEAKWHCKTSELAQMYSSKVLH